jgi:hypothetical protein
MKTFYKSKISFFILAIICLQFGTLFAVNDTTELIIPEKEPLAFVMPDIDDASDGAPATEINITKLAPVMPLEAGFEENTIAESSIMPEKIAPVVPAVADFSDDEVR